MSRPVTTKCLKTKLITNIFWYFSVKFRGFTDQVTQDLSYIEEVLEIHEMHNRFDLFLKIRVKDLNDIGDIVENKIRKLPYILETELMTVLKSSKEEQMVTLSKDI